MWAKWQNKVFFNSIQFSIGTKVEEWSSIRTKDEKWSSSGAVVEYDEWSRSGAKDEEWRMAGVYVDCRCGCVCVDVCVYPGAQQVVLSPSVYILYIHYTVWWGGHLCRGGRKHQKQLKKRVRNTWGSR